jgi:HEAT repeat protein
MKKLAIALVVVAVGAAAYWKLRPMTAPRQQQDLAALQAAYEHETDSNERALLLRRASTLSERGVARWLARVAETEPQLAAQASSALGAIKNRGEAGDLAELASAPTQVVVRANAARALATVGSSREAPALAALLGDRAQPLRVRQEAALALGGIGDKSSIPLLVKTIQSSPEDEQLRISAIQALGRLGTADAHTFLTTYAQSELSQTERAFVARATATTAAPR